MAEGSKDLTSCRLRLLAIPLNVVQQVGISTKKLTSCLASRRKLSTGPHWRVTSLFLYILRTSLLCAFGKNVGTGKHVGP